jgi:dTDP-D-glucose 4,6-dehydratase
MTSFKEYYKEQILNESKNDILKLKNKEVTPDEFKQIRMFNDTKTVGIVHGKDSEKKNNKNKYEVVFKDLPGDDPTRRKPDIAKAKEILNWEPKVSFKEGLQKTILSFKI